MTDLESEVVRWAHNITDERSLYELLASLGYVIIRDPAHAPEAVEAAAEKIFGWLDADYLSVEQVDRFKNHARAAIAAYIEKASK